MSIFVPPTETEDPLRKPASHLVSPRPALRFLAGIVFAFLCCSDRSFGQVWTDPSWASVETRALHLASAAGVEKVESIEKELLKNAPPDDILNALLSTDNPAGCRALARAIWEFGDLARVPLLDPYFSTKDQGLLRLLVGMACELETASAADKVSALLIRDLPSDRILGLQGLVGLGVPMPKQAVPLLKDKDPLVRETVVLALSHWNRKELAHAIVPLLDDPAPRVRGAACRALANLGHTEAIPKIADSLDDQGDYPIGQESLVNPPIEVLPPQRETPALDLLPVPAFGVRGDALRALGQLKATGFSSQVLSLLRSDPDPAFRRTASEVLIELNDPKTVPNLVEILDNPNRGHESRSRSLVVLASISPRSLAPRIPKLLEDENPALRNAVLTVVSASGDPIYAEAVLELAEKAPSQLPSTAWDYLIASQPHSAFTRLENFLLHPNPVVGARAADVLGRLGDRRAITTLEPLLESRAEPLRKSAALALARLEGSSAVEALFALYTKDNGGLCIAEALRALPPSAVAPRALALLEKLGPKGDPSRISSCLFLLEKEPSPTAAQKAEALLFHNDDRVVRSALRVVESAGLPSSVESLGRFLTESRDPWLRLAVAEVLCSLVPEGEEWKQGLARQARCHSLVKNATKWAEDRLRKR